MTAGGHSFSFWGLGWWMCGANLGHCNGSAINYPVLSEIEWDDVTCLCVNVLYMFVHLRMFCRKYLHPLGTCMLFIFLSFFHFCTHFVPNISMPDPKCLRMTPPCVFVCLCRPSREGLQDYSCLLPVGSGVVFLPICCSHGPEFLQRGILGGQTRDFLYITAVADCDKLPAVYQQVAEDLRDARSIEHRG